MKITCLCRKCGQTFKAGMFDEKDACPLCKAAEPMRRMCAWCKRDLPGSNLNADANHTTHGMCFPPCKPAQDAGFILGSDGKLAVTLPASPSSPVPHGQTSHQLSVAQACGKFEIVP